jgi:hypothetical protein
VMMSVLEIRHKVDQTQLLIMHFVVKFNIIESALVIYSRIKSTDNRTFFPNKVTTQMPTKIT